MPRPKSNKINEKFIYLIISNFDSKPHEMNILIRKIQKVYLIKQYV